ncbi:MAG: YlmC/YmxH family sporulation protein [Clostridiales bacterium]|nr:YlmC/YmxH family sporulation protein [Candidatus Apopatousia equi]
MGDCMETSFCDLKSKEVINIVDGKRLGHIIDMVFETSCGKILGLVVPGSKCGFNIFKSVEDIFIPYQNICKIGYDCILVELFNQNKCGVNVLKESTTYTTTANVVETSEEKPNATTK